MKHWYLLPLIPIYAVVVIGGVKMNARKAKEAWEIFNLKIIQSEKTMRMARARYMGEEKTIDGARAILNESKVGALVKCVTCFKDIGFFEVSKHYEKNHHGIFGLAKAKNAEIIVNTDDIPPWDEREANNYA